MGELHLEIIVDRLNVSIKLKLFKVNYKLLIKKQFKSLLMLKVNLLSNLVVRGQYGHVWIKLEPFARGKGYEFENKVVGGSIPREFIPGVEKGLEEAINTGVSWWFSCC